jgi:PAS domain S-box-containing protein
MAESGVGGDVRLRAAVDSSPSGLLMVDDKGSIVLVNREIERMFGYSREELLGRPVEALVPERYRKAHPGDRAGFFAAPRIRSMGAGRELFGRRKDGSEVPIEIGLTPIATDDGLFVISSIVDVTTRREAEADRRRLEEELRQSQKMEAVGRLAAGIAHDFNNVLSAIVGYAELARDSEGHTHAAGDIDALLAVAARGRDLVDRILQFGRRQKAELRPLDLSRSVEEAMRFLRATLPASVEVRLDLGNEPARILADATSVQQVLVNLVTNAAHAMPSGGKVEIGVAPFYVRDNIARSHPGVREGAYAALRVRDSGHGMDEETRSRAFEPFFTTKPAGQGSGLGLSMVHGILREHAGAVWLTSEVGVGTEVTCLFPMLEGLALDGPDAVADIPRGHGERLLLVDDEPTLLDTGRRRLEGLGYRVETASGVQQALDAVRAAGERFALVLTDYSMPLANGVDLARELTRSLPGVPIVLVSGYSEELDPEELLAVGIRRLLQKPFTLREIAVAVRGALDEAEASAH